MVANNAGKPATPADLINVDEVIGKYYDLVPDPAVPEQRVIFGTSGHRGSSLKTSFNEAHIVAITQAIAEYRKKAGVTGPLYLGSDTHDPTWRFMTIDHDGKIRMDPSSPYAMKGLVDQLNAGAWDKYDLVGGTDPDADRHGIVCPNWGVMNPNHYIAVCVEYLFGGNRPGWPEGTGIGKTLVSSSLIDRVALSINAKLVEVPVGFKWFVDPLFSGEVAFGGEESSGMSFLRRDGRVWTTDKDGLIPDLLAAEITAKTGKNPALLHQDQVARFGESWYKRVDTPTTLEQKAKFAKLTGDDVAATQLAGEDITAKLTEAPGNHAKIGGLKVTTKDNWFAARPSGTENIYKVYAESFVSPEALDKVLDEAKLVVDKALGE